MFEKTGNPNKVVRDIKSIPFIKEKLCDLPDISVSPDLNCIDIGNVRIQWGNYISTSDVAEEFSFPKPFGGPPVLTSSLKLDSGSGHFAILNVTTTNFSVNRVDSIDNPANPEIHWIAIGQKP